MKTVTYRPVGIIHSPFKQTTGVPRQSAGAANINGTIEIFDDYSEGLKDLDGFSHIVVIFHLHMVTRSSLKACPPWDGKEHGVFATRSPHRPNPVGVSVVRLERVVQNILHISGIDMVDGSPVLDIKPYVPELNPAGNIRTGWLAGKVEAMNKSKSGDR